MSVDTEGKSLVELLDMLEPAPLPSTVSMVPQTWGWVVLGLIVVAMSGLAVHSALRHRKANAYRRSALAELQQAQDDPAAVASILRRTALAAFPRRDIAGLHGSDWITFLEQTSENITVPEPSKQHLLRAPYRPEAPDAEVTKLARHWIMTHRRDGGRP